ncbi:MAG: HAD-IIA family hydrolase [Arcanobacterium sp.]|nr:HAD-IIA family hydrolase [Arcanobacterium sp.]
MTELGWPTEFAQAYVFDMDGTIYLGDELLPGAKRMIETLREKEIPVRFLSNNPTKDPQQYVEKLAKLGLPTAIEDISNTVVTTRNWLLQNHPDAKLFVIGEEPLQRALREAGFELTEDPEQIDVVVASYDRGFNYEKLQIAFDAIWFHRRAILIQTNPDRFCPFPGGRGEPDCAAITAAIEACTGVKCSANLGKPSPIMLESSISDLDVELSKCVMVGDRLQTDIQMAIDCGMLSACVLTGEATLDDVAARTPDQRPTWTLDRIDKLIPQSVWEEKGWTEAD